MSIESTGTDRVVVGVDGSSGARPALEWAAREAEGRRATLVLVMAQELAVPAPSEAGWTFGLDDVLRESTERLLDEAAELVRRRHPDLDVTTQGVFGSPAAALIEASRHATLVVVGSRGAGGWPGLLLGSVSGAVAAHGHCPVVVVPDRCEHTDPQGPVVVGVDDSAESARAAAFALAEADGRGVPVVAVHAWTLSFHGGVVPTEEGSEPYTSMREQQSQLVTRVLEHPRAAHPDVPVEHRIVRSTSVSALTEASRGASLVVVGSRGRGGFAGMLLGSTSRQLLQTSQAPVAVVRV
ncbi:universal stress protein [Arsenicicoccus sp. oral taxon 190]|uniref:universal stress protein n=1 Tax=Arsenicicoccus sp. oral taxon 190 TaxID=1658671 RepID=UPI00067A0DFE|nr:universal stress protein [Arsenicicoccus sp. oral taxon 190]AKT51857.1 hypothetical protein ADJ73_12290 [Arsenicicoccus sp. oral taxon 190]